MRPNLIRTVLVVGVWLFNGLLPSPLDVIADIAVNGYIAWSAGRFLLRLHSHHLTMFAGWMTDRLLWGSRVRPVAPSSRDLRTVGRPLDVMTVIRNVTLTVAFLAFLPAVTKEIARIDRAHRLIADCPGHECEVCNR